MMLTRRTERTIVQLAGIALAIVLAGVTSQAQQFRFTSFDVPGAAKCTSARGINSKGDIVGVFCDSNGKEHGFLLTGLGGTNQTFHVFDFPASLSPTHSVLATAARGINDNGDITGNIFDGTGQLHGYLLTGFPAGPTFYLIDFPASQSPTGKVTGTFVGKINTGGDIVGDYMDGSPTPNPAHGFKLTGFPSTPQFTQIDFPGAVATEATGINDAGEIVGIYSLNAFFLNQAYLLSGDRFTTLTTPVGQSTAWGINNHHEIVGWFGGGGVSVAGLTRGDLFIGGTFMMLMFPGSIGTANLGNNSAGVIVGDYRSTDGITHGFLATPDVP